MKTLKLFAVLFLASFAMIAGAQTASDWTMTVNHDNSAFKIKVSNNEITFYFNPAKDTLSFAQATGKAIKNGVVIEISLKNNNKVIYTSADKNLNADKTVITIPMAQVYSDAKNSKLPSKPKYMLSIKDRTVVKDKLSFEFTE